MKNVIFVLLMGFFLVGLGQSFADTCEKTYEQKTFKEKFKDVDNLASAEFAAELNDLQGLSLEETELVKPVTQSGYILSTIDLKALKTSNRFTFKRHEFRDNYITGNLRSNKKNKERLYLE